MPVEKQLLTPQNHIGGATKGVQGVQAGNLIYIGGQMSLDENDNVVGSDIKTQAHNAFDSVQRVLAEAGATMKDVVKHNVFFVCDGDDETVAKLLDELDEVRLDYFSDPGPTTTEVRCGLEREGALILVDAWAVVGAEKERLMPEGHWSWKKELPFSHGWKVGDMIFVGGQRSFDQNGDLIGEGDIEIQTAETFRNLETVLQEGGGDRNNLMRQNTFFRFFGEGRDVTDYWEKMTAVRRQYMSVPSAAGAGLRINGFPNSKELIQVEGIGVLGENKTRLNPENHWGWSIEGNEFTQGWQIGDMVFIGGQISADNKAKAVGDDMEAQTRNVFEFIRRVLNMAGLDESDVAKLYIYYHADGDAEKVAATKAVIDAVQREFYPTPGPAATSIRVAGFAFEDLLIEIEAMAVCR
jgi:enamine deaminase RidA (YjgF/YER057c/UK114 family)